MNNIKIKNTTDLSTRIINQIHAFVEPVGISQYDIMIKNRTTEKAVAGRAFTWEAHIITQSCLSWFVASLKDILQFKLYMKSPTSLLN